MSFFASPSSGYSMSGGYADSAFFPVKNGRYMVELKIMSADCSYMASMSCMKLVKSILGDVGSDLTLLKYEEAQRLGYDLDQVYDSFPVQGISGDPTEFKEVQTWVQIQGMRPLYAPVGFATMPGGLQENLLGNKGILDSGYIEAVYTHNGVLYRTSHQGVNII